MNPATEKFKKPRPQRISPMADRAVKTDEEDLTPTPETARRMAEQLEDEQIGRAHV